MKKVWASKKPYIIAKIVLLLSVIVVICLPMQPVHAEVFNALYGWQSVQTNTVSNSYLIVGTSDTSSYESVSYGETPDISNTPNTLDFGMVQPATTYYAKGTAPNNPVIDGDCTFTVTNNGSGSVNLYMSITDFTGGNTWNIVSGVPSGDEIKITAYYSGQNPAAGLVLTNSDQLFYSGLAGSGTIMWDFQELTGGEGSGDSGTFSDPNEKTATLTIVAS